CKSISADSVSGPYIPSIFRLYPRFCNLDCKSLTAGPLSPGLNVEAFVSSACTASCALFSSTCVVSDVWFALVSSAGPPYASTLPDIIGAKAKDVAKTVVTIYFRTEYLPLNIYVSSHFLRILLVDFYR